MSSVPMCTELTYERESENGNADTPSISAENERPPSICDTPPSVPVYPKRRAWKRYSESRDNLTAEVFYPARNHFKKPYQYKDRFDVFGAAVAVKLRDLSKRQRILAEKIINEILYEAEMDNLTVTHKLINSPYPTNTSTNTPSSIAHSTLSPMHNSYFASNPNYILGYSSQLPQPISQPSHQTIIHPQPTMAVPNPAVVEISIPESAAHYWANFNYDTV